jgi:hypothetical protein
MSQPIVVTLPHRLGKAEALRRLQVSFRDAQSSGAGLLVFKNQWSGDHMHFRASLLGQSTPGQQSKGPSGHWKPQTFSPPHCLIKRPRKLVQLLRRQESW